MAAMTVTTKLNTLRVLFNKVDEIYFKKSAIDMLNYWKEQQEILDFELVKHGPKDYSIHIFL